MNDDTFAEFLAMQSGIAEIEDVLPDNMSKRQIATMLMAMQTNGMSIALKSAALELLTPQALLSCAVAAKSLSEALVDQASIRER